MCWACDHPTAELSDYLENLRAVIRKCGWAVQGVERDRVHPPWAYTVGLTAHGRPELVVTGLALDRSQELLNAVAAHLLHADVPAAGVQVELIGGPLIEYVELSEPSAHLRMAVELYGTELRALQLVHADDRGRWPWDRGYRGGRGGQPVLGMRSRHTADPPTA
ncbi:DUF4262 domain-containing protein [Lentzea sp. NPDC051213]|uniref:DUF4262 domain-containing protein n=1 Tax=Lentzea sp. NPDC051213 TaxID=3364126 RepID=UPI0037BBE3AF